MNLNGHTHPNFNNDGYKYKMKIEIPTSYLEIEFPHIYERISIFWGFPAEFESYMNSLIIDDRGGRQGFPTKAMTEIFMLMSVHTSIYKKTNVKPNVRTDNIVG